MKGCRPLTSAEIDAVLQSFTGKFALRDQAIFIFGLKTGFRISEILSVRVRQVWQYGRVLDAVTIPKQYCKDQLESQTVPLHHELRAVIQELIDSYGQPSPDDFLFKSRKGQNRPISRQRAWAILKRLYVKNEMSGKLATHSMRKTFANRIYMRFNRDLLKTQRAMRHRRVDNTIKYLDFCDEEVDKAILEL